MLCRRHQGRKWAEVNCGPASVTRYFGDIPNWAMSWPRKCRTFSEVGCCLKTVEPRAFREKWSMTIATHQQNGQHCGSVNGSQGTQKPEAVGTTVRSTC